jgi:apolipoprotein N-acyltransferase
LERRFAWRSAATALVVGALPAAAAIVYGRAVLPAPGEPSDGTSVAVVQGHIGLAERWHRYFHGRNLKTYLELTNDVLDQSGATLVVWPEAAMTFLLEDQPDYQRSIASLLHARGSELISGIPYRANAKAGDAEPYYNSVILLSEEGEVRGRYDKEYLLPFAEYVPLADVPVMKTLFGRFREFSRGDGAALLPTRVGLAGVLVCNEAVLPEAARGRARRGAEFLVNPSNDSWSRHPKFTGQWFDIVRFRAIEERRYLIRASTSGPSAVVDPWGRVQARTERYARGAASGRIEARSELSVYGRVGDLFAIGCTVVVFAALLRKPRRAL